MSIGDVSMTFTLPVNPTMVGPATTGTARPGATTGTVRPPAQTGSAS